MIRTAVTEDIAALEILFAEGDAFHAAGAPDVFHAPRTPARPDEFYRRVFTDPLQCMFVAITDEKLVGVVHIVLRDVPLESVFNPGRLGVTDSVVVRSMHRGYGFGHQLMQHAEQWALEQGASAIELNVWEFPGSAIPFYEQLGYQSRLRRMRKHL